MTVHQRSGYGLVLMLVPYLLSAVICGRPSIAQEQEKKEPIEEIVIIGSRIPRRDFSAPSPIVTLDAAEIRLSGTTNIEDIVNTLPQVVPDGDRTLNNTSGRSIATLNLRGLGRHRALTMLNGRRFSPSVIGGGVDVNNFPAALIERVEVVTGGASAAYGSDAVVGVVNFVIDDEFDGVSVNAQYETTQETDGDIVDVSVSAGMPFGNGRGHISGFLNFNDRQKINAIARDFTTKTIADDADTGELVEAGSFTVPGGRITFPNTIIDGQVLSDVVFEPDGTLRASDFPDDFYNFNADIFLQTPLERYIAGGFLNYDITPNVSGTLEAMYSRNEHTTQFAPTPAIRFVTVAVDSPFLPDETRQVFRDSFDPDGDGFAEFFFLKRLIEVGNRQFVHDRTLWRALVGLDGALGDTWRWESWYSWTDVDLDPTSINAVSADRYLQAVLQDPVTGGCLDPSNGCVAANVFGAGNMSAEAADFMRFDTIRNVHTVTEQVASLGFAGDLVPLPAGPVGVALGLEWRRLEGELSSDPAPLRLEVLGVAGFQPAIGAIEVNEAYAEILVPLLSGRRLAEYLAIEAGARRSDYNTAGIVSTWKAGVEWLPVEGLRFRAMFQRAIRAPNIIELFEEPVEDVQTAFGPNWDPCSAGNDPVGNGVGDICIAQGMDPALLGVFVAPGPNFVNFTFGGNPRVKSEEADSITAGLVFRPKRIEGFSMSVDYFDIEIRDAIQNIGTSSLDVCFAQGDPHSEFCSDYTRDASGRIATGNIHPTNVAVQRSEGVDLQVIQSMDSEALGTFAGAATIELNLQATHYFSNGSQGRPLTPFVDCAGYFGGFCDFSSFGTLPDWRTRTRLAYQSGPLQVTLGWDWVAGTKNSTTLLREFFGLPSPTLAIPEIGSTSYFDLSASWDFSDSLQLYGGVQNLLNNGPPLLAGNAPGLNTDTATFDAIGRRYYLGLHLMH